jgi:hypothetical protein
MSFPRKRESISEQRVMQICSRKTQRKFKKLTVSNAEYTSSESPLQMVVYHMSQPPLDFCHVWGYSGFGETRGNKEGNRASMELIEKAKQYKAEIALAALYIYVIILGVATLKELGII